VGLGDGFDAVLGDAHDLDLWMPVQSCDQRLPYQREIVGYEHSDHMMLIRRFG